MWRHLLTGPTPTRRVEAQRWRAVGEGRHEGGVGVLVRNVDDGAGR
eukprot:CAMPEP_0194770902 /NCGR_PEP_ID=MMETSP0323_2-20130528/47622_1 /TAXON_ID=2866 ORGANISM="Crypthecodinium cohnii, Strain Seligo" /NCGR_SAMPLE_ID=MMETSP0323_2 /ASSEMBLY_ACC=CAM_ASM_000346 /LENGTH=45 /DNA_ID= /DNA_START= /DNA_END= /DNA_ORIENTATION=